MDSRVKVWERFDFADYDDRWSFIRRRDLIAMRSASLMSWCAENVMDRVNGRTAKLLAEYEWLMDYSTMDDLYVDPGDEDAIE